MKLSEFKNKRREKWIGFEDAEERVADDVEAAEAAGREWDPEELELPRRLVAYRAEDRGSSFNWHLGCDDPQDVWENGWPSQEHQRVGYQAAAAAYNKLQAGKLVDTSSIPSIAALACIWPGCKKRALAPVLCLDHHLTPFEPGEVSRSIFNGPSRSAALYHDAELDRFRFVLEEAGLSQTLEVVKNLAKFWTRHTNHVDPRVSLILNVIGGAVHVLKDRDGSTGPVTIIGAMDRLLKHVHVEEGADRG